MSHLTVAIKEAQEFNTLQGQQTARSWFGAESLLPLKEETDVPVANINSSTSAALMDRSALPSASTAVLTLGHPPDSAAVTCEGLVLMHQVRLPRPNPRRDCADRPEPGMLGVQPCELPCPKLLVLRGVDGTW
eukprot:CAMPEP_0178376932 /NCGR_PEP_ID=MMETSP0689_2-20121128/3657_1 /TAXON_ID=160604 /ORGANISM="Amphidinium massartii, Strain CS-259" /LENGTH=132 /DNA_ID=CAMNT_0019996969 /DNA_START=480 /DNA_END=879 /DNA_ORIENTATION=-